MNLGIPYMGSKRKLAQDILKTITARHNGITDYNNNVIKQSNAEQLI